MFGNMLLKSSSVNQLEIPAPGSKSQSCGADVAVHVNKAPGVGTPAGGVGIGGVGAGAASDGVGAAGGVGIGGVGAGAASDGVGAGPSHLHKSAKLQGHHVCTPLAQGAHCSSVTA